MRQFRGLRKDLNPARVELAAFLEKMADEKALNPALRKLSRADSEFWNASSRSSWSSRATTAYLQRRLVPWAPLEDRTS